MQHTLELNNTTLEALLHDVRHNSHAMANTISTNYILLNSANQNASINESFEEVLESVHSCSGALGCV